MAPVGAFTVPRSLAEAVSGEGRAWGLAAWPGAGRALARRWSRRIDERIQPGGSTAWVAPVTDAGGTELVPKVVCHHTEAAREADGLREWDGDGAARLYAVQELDD